LSATNTSLQTLIRVAYRVGVPQISGPAWMAGTRFDITAKGSLEDVSLAVMALKIRNLMAERFGLKVHEESRMQTALVLTNGARIVPSEGGDAVLHLSRTAIAGKNISMDEFMRGLSDATGDLYVDQSGFTGRFDIDITWSRVPAELIGEDDGPPALSTVLREKFGLEVKAQKMSVVVLVVDRVDKNPTDN
jgi:uncharacterized protein (TIGR03435 family)